MSTRLSRLLLALVFTALTTADPVTAAAPPTSTRPAAPAGRSPWSVTAEVGLGYDSNAYRAPGASYVDYSAAGTPLVVPDTQSGFFLPARLEAGYRGDFRPGIRLEPSYRFDGHFYGQSDLTNANEYDHEIELRTELTPAGSGRRAVLSLTPYVGDHRQVYVDHDSGLDKTTTGGVDISNRYSYRNAGIKAAFTSEVGIVDYTVKAEAAALDYEDPGVVSQIDHTYYLIGGDAEVRLAGPAKLGLAYDYSVRDYDERPARDLQGNFAVPAVPLTYAYHTFDASLRTRPAKDLAVTIEYELTIRSDGYVGYNDYTQDKYRLRAVAGGRGRGRLAAWISYADRDYPHAFAFDNALQPQKTFQTLQWSLKGDWTLAPQWALWSEIRSWDQDTTDLRYDYTRYVAMAGLRWDPER